MGKINKMVSLLFILSFSFFSSCRQEQVVLYQGTANVRIESDSFQDTLRSCTCWFSSDALSLKIGNLQLSGITIDVTSKGGVYKVTPKFVQDTDENLDGTIIPIKDQSVKIDYFSDGKSIIINGTLLFQSLWQSPITDKVNEKLSIKGSFTCELTKNK